MGCYVLYGRQIQWKQTITPSHHMIRQILAHSPLMTLMIRSTHRLIGCNAGIALYVNHLRMTGFNSVNLEQSVTNHKQFCQMCPRIKCIMNTKNPAQALASRYTRGPDSFLAATLQKDPLAICQLDEA